MSLSVKQVSETAHLARLELSDVDRARMVDQLSAILDYVQQLDQLDTTNVEPMAHPLPMTNVFRADEPVPSLAVDQALANAPARHGDYFSVPAVLD